MKFSEETLELTVIELFYLKQIKVFDGRYNHNEIGDILLRDDLKLFLLNQF